MPSTNDGDRAIIPSGKDAADDWSPDPAPWECMHGSRWVVDTTTKRIVRRRCLICERAADAEQANEEALRKRTLA